MKKLLNTFFIKKQKETEAKQPPNFSLKEQSPKQPKQEVTNSPKTQINDHQFYQEEDSTVDSLINMSNIIRISKTNKDLKYQFMYEYLTLCYINEVLCEDEINVWEIKQYLVSKVAHIELSKFRSSSEGLIYQNYPVRALLWKVALGYLPNHKNKWISLLETNLLKYKELVEKHIVEYVNKKGIRKESSKEIEEGEVQVQECKKVLDHPLNRQKESKWLHYFEDSQLWSLIEKDTKRTRPNSLFFHTEYNPDHLSQTTPLTLSKSTKTYYYDALTRIIYIYLKQHPQSSYCQGFNQLAAILMYSFTNMNSEYFRRVSESDCYFCFEKIVDYMGAGFMNGEKCAKKFEEILKKVDLRMWEAVDVAGYTNNLYLVTVRWFNSYFISEFELDDSLILYDGYIAVSPITQTSYKQSSILPRISWLCFTFYIGLAIIHLNRIELAEGTNPLLLFGKIKDTPHTILEKVRGLIKIFGVSLMD